jgi:hypothetical protein
MRNKTLLIGLLFATTALTGCDDDVTKVCKKMSELVKKEKDAPKKMKEEADDIEGCKTKLAEQQKEDPEKFAKMATCVDGAADLKGLFECMMPKDAK